jgi:hypothetical protein
VSALLRAELLKLRTTRTFGTIVGVAAATSLLIAVLVALLTEPTRNSVLVDVYASDTSSYFILILGVVGITGEWRHRTITSSLLAAPDRPRFLAAKAAAYAGAGFVLSAAVAAAVTVAGTAILAIRDLPLADPAELAGQYARNAVLAALLGAFGVAIGGLVRNQIAAVVGVLSVSLVVEPVILSLAPSVGRFGPFGALSLAAAGLPNEAGGIPASVDLVSQPVAVALLAAWIAVALLAATALLAHRDLE